MAHLDEGQEHVGPVCIVKLVVLATRHEAIRLEGIGVLVQPVSALRYNAAALTTTSLSALCNYPTTHSEANGQANGIMWISFACFLLGRNCSALRVSVATATEIVTPRALLHRIQPSYWALPGYGK